jgi:hypothetical protein
MPTIIHTARIFDRAGWMFRRLYLMSPGEVLFRIGRWLRNKAWRLFPPTAGEPGTPAPIVWLGDLHEEERVRAFLRRQFHWDESAAQEYLHHRFSFFRLEHADFGPTITWNHDYRNGITPPLGFGPAMDYRNVTLCGDIKYVWEHNRHHQLVELAKAYYLTGKQEYADEVLAQVESWIEQCPYLQGVHWSSSLESAVRVINWCFAYRFLAARPGGYLEHHADFLTRWSKSIHQHLVFISRFFSRYSSANNHLIGEACGLYVGALCFTYSESSRWLRTSKQILEDEALRQIWPDGVDKEQAVSYQSFVFDFLLIAGLLGRRNGREFSAQYWERLERMAEFVSSLIDGRGDVPHIGDEDDGYVVILSHGADFKPYRSLVATAAVLFQRGDLARVAVRYDEKSFWMLGFQDFQAVCDRGQGHMPPISFPFGGYYILKGGGGAMIVDCGPLGYLSLAAHGHADALSIILAYKDCWFLVDPGTYAYHTQGEWRDYFRGTAAHNAVRVDGMDQSVIGGNFMWLRKARCQVIRRDDRVVVGWHDGYMRLSQHVRHEREVRFDDKDRSYRVIDRIQGNGKHSVELFFHLSPECSLREEEGSYVLTNGSARIILDPDRQLRERTVLCGSLSPRGGWYSPGYDRKMPSTTLRLAMTTGGSTELVTTLLLR